jgi:fructose-1,6-bisphosphatase
MKEVVVNNKTYKVIKKYPYYTLCEDEHGFRTCFDDFDLGKIRKRRIIDWRRKMGISIYRDDKNV